MKKTTNKKFSNCLNVIIVFHVIMISLHLSPDNPIKAKYKGLVNSYMSPLFTQNWNLFAPEPPTSSSKLWIKCNRGSWLDPAQSILTKHQAIRAGNWVKVLYVYRYHSREMIKLLNLVTEKNKCDKQDLNCYSRYVMDSPTYRTIRRMAIDGCTNHLGSSPSQIQVMVIVSPVRPYSKRKEKNYSAEYFKSHKFIEELI